MRTILVRRTRTTSSILNQKQHPMLTFFHDLYIFHLYPIPARIEVSRFRLGLSSWERTKLDFKEKSEEDQQKWSAMSGPGDACLVVSLLCKSQSMINYATLKRSRMLGFFLDFGEGELNKGVIWREIGWKKRWNTGRRATYMLCFNDSTSENGRWMLENGLRLFLAKKYIFKVLFC